MLSIPLSAGDRVVGALNLYSRLPNAFDANAEQAAQPLANYAVEIISTSALYAYALEMVDGLVESLEKPGDHCSGHRDPHNHRAAIEQGRAGEASHSGADQRPPHGTVSAVSRISGGSRLWANVLTTTASEHRQEPAFGNRSPSWCTPELWGGCKYAERTLEAFGGPSLTKPPCLAGRRLTQRVAWCQVRLEPRLLLGSPLHPESRVVVGSPYGSQGHAAAQVGPWGRLRAIAHRARTTASYDGLVE